MKNANQPIVSTSFVLMAMLGAAQITSAQDPAKVDLAHYKVLYENNAVRMLEYHDAPGHKVPKHSHPAYFVYVISDAKRLFTDWSSATDCTGKGKTVMLTAGESLSKPPITHCEETPAIPTHTFLLSNSRAASGWVSIGQENKGANYGQDSDSKQQNPYCRSYHRSLCTC